MIRLRLREIAESKGLSISDVHYGAQVSLTTVRRYWYNETKAVYLDNLESICRYLNVSPGELFAMAPD